MDYMSIIAYIPAGRDNSITREKLSRLTGRTDRLNRKAIEEARKAGVPVISSSHGAVRGGRADKAQNGGIG